MKATELRIGNLVIVDNFEYHPNLKDIPLSVTGINPTRYIDKESSHAIGLEHIYKDENRYYESYSQFIEYIKPIPLTEQLFKKLGGKLMSGWYGMFFNNEVFDETVEITFELMDGILTVFANDTRIKVIKEPFVHQLQNLVSELTGTELQIQSK